MLIASSSITEKEPSSPRIKCATPLKNVPASGRTSEGVILPPSSTIGIFHDEMGLRLRRRKGRRRSQYARPPRGEGRKSRRNVESRPARAARLHHHDRGLHLFLRQ